MAHKADVNLGIKIWKNQETISRILRTIARREFENEARRFIPEKLSGRQRDMLLAVSYLCDEQSRDLSLKELADALGISSATASVMLDALVTQDLLRRSTNPEDRRRKCIRLSPRAEELLANGDAAVQEIILQTAQNFEPDYLTKWDDILTRFEQQLKKRG
jgi:DNA-binding MarR family transcriptional regulator